MVAAGLARRCEVQLAYAIGVAEPVSVRVDTFGTGDVPDEQIAAALRRRTFDLTPGGIIERLELRAPDLSCAPPRTATSGARPSAALDGARSSFSWERTDRVDALRAAAGS